MRVKHERSGFNCRRQNTLPTYTTILRRRNIKVYIFNALSKGAEFVFCWFHVKIRVIHFVHLGLLTVYRTNLLMEIETLIYYLEKVHTITN